MHYICTDYQNVIIGIFDLKIFVDYNAILYFIGYFTVVVLVFFIHIEIIYMKNHILRNKNIRFPFFSLFFWLQVVTGIHSTVQTANQ